MTTDEIKHAIDQLETELLERVQLREQLASKLLKQRNALLEACKKGYTMLDAIRTAEPARTILWEDLEAVVEELHTAIAQVESEDQ